MQFNVDKRFIEILNEKGASITWDQFRSAYEVRKIERENTPEAKKRVARRIAEDDRELGLARMLYLAQLEGVSGV